MFNEIGYSSSQLGGLGFLGRTAECQGIKDNCDRRFPVTPGMEDGSEPDTNWECMKAGGYPTKCMDNRSYENPGSTTYPIDVLTNPDNPNTVWQWPDFVKNVADGMGLTPAVMVGIGAAVLLGLFAMRR